MKAIAIALAATFTVAAWAVPQEAQASAPGCATRAEWRHVHKGQTVRQVRRTVHARGHLRTSTWWDGQRTAVLWFHVCGSTYGEAIAYLSTTDPAPLRLTEKDFTR